MKIEDINLLIVDDKKANIVTVEDIIKDGIDYKCNFYEASNGEDALTIAMEEKINLIILDIQMPGMDGFEVAKFLKSSKKTKDIPILFLTAVFKSEEFQQRGFDMGAVDYMTKPIDENQFLNRINLYLKLFSRENELKAYKNHLQELVDEKTKKIENFYITDDLTGLKNRNYLTQIISDKKERTLLLLNIDNFSIINDNYGYEIGDMVLKECGRVLSILQADNMDLLRVDGDEFAFIFDSEDKGFAYNFALEIKDRFEKHKIIINNIDFHLSFTMGIDSGDTIQVLRNVSLSIKDIRELGKNHINIYQPDSKYENNQKRNIYWINKLQNLLKTGHLTPYFQPIVDTSNNTISKHECLARVIDDFEIITPNIFIEPAKLIGLISEITKQMIQKSFELIQNTDKEISINIVEEDLKENFLISFLEEKRVEYGLKASQIVLEILESISTSSSDINKINQLHQLKKLGYKLAIDDFGTENSNFSRLLELDVDYLKIDGSFIKNIDKDKNSQKIVQAITSFAKSIGAKTIAEFVHNKEVYDKVKEYGIDFVQGYYIGKPDSKITN